MKTRVTITLDADLLAFARTRAGDRGMSVSGLIEELLRDRISGPPATFAARWRGRFRPAPGGDPRKEALAGKYGSELSGDAEAYAAQMERYLGQEPGVHHPEGQRLPTREEIHARRGGEDGISGEG